LNLPLDANLASPVILSAAKDLRSEASRCFAPISGDFCSDLGFLDKNGEP